MAVVYLSPRMALDPVSGAQTREDWSDPIRTDAPGAFVLDSSSSKLSDGTNQTTTEAKSLFIPEGEVEPKPGDRIQDGTLTYVMEGVPLRDKNPYTGWAPYAEVRLERRS